MADRVGRNIVLLSDGTGNSAGKLFKTNVWRVYDALDLSNASQIASYDDGVGTSSIKPLAVFGGAVGWGLKRNVLSLYSFLCLNYKAPDPNNDEPGDQIFAFGFSRGAFTIRVLINFVLSQGLVDDATSSDDLHRKALRLYRKFRVQQTLYVGLHTIARPLRDLSVWLGDWICGRRIELRNIKTRQVPEIAFLGLWDTVDAYGVPVVEFGKGVDQWIWPLSLRDKTLDGRIKKACHALSIDDKRKTFHPLLWDETELEPSDHTDDETLTQVWFAGAHANVGGGYPDDALAYVPLRWMIKEAGKRGARFNPLAVAALEVKVSPYGRIYNPRAGLGAYYRYDPRRLDPPRDHQGATIPNPKVHETVVWRMAMGTDAYAPLALPNGVRVVTESRYIRKSAKDGRPASYLDAPNKPNVLTFEAYRKAIQKKGDLFGAPAGRDAEMSRRKRVAVDFSALQQMPDEHKLDLIWDTVWWRRVSYFMTLLLSAFLLFAPAYVDDSAKTVNFGENLAWMTIPITRVAGLASGFLPSFVSPWIETFQAKPFLIGFLALMVLVSTVWGALLDRRIHDRALAAWTGKGAANRTLAARASVKLRMRTALMVVVPLTVIVALFLILELTLLAGSILSSVGYILAGVVFVPELPFLIWLICLIWIWRKGRTTEGEIRGPALWLANRMRTWRITAIPYRVFAQKILPTAFAALLIATIFVSMSRVAFDFMESGGWICESNLPSTKTVFPANVVLNTNDVCQLTGVQLEAGKKYRIDVTNVSGWKDDGGTTVSPFPTTSMSMGWDKLLELPLRRKLTKPWFAIVARVGQYGNEEYMVLKPGVEFTPKDAGFLFLFVNDAVIGWTHYARFYSRNEGTASVTISEVVAAAAK